MCSTGRFLLLLLLLQLLLLAITFPSATQLFVQHDSKHLYKVYNTNTAFTSNDRPDLPQAAQQDGHRHPVPHSAA